MYTISEKYVAFGNIQMPEINQQPHQDARHEGSLQCYVHQPI